MRLYGMRVKSETGKGNGAADKHWHLRTEAVCSKTVFDTGSNVAKTPGKRGCRLVDSKKFAGLSTRATPLPMRCNAEDVNGDQDG